MEAVFLHVLDVGFTAGLAVLGVLLLRLLCAKAPKWITVLLWGIVGLRLLMPFSIESAVGLIPSWNVSTVIETTAQTVSPEHGTVDKTPSSQIPVLNTNEQEEASQGAVTQTTPTDTIASTVPTVTWSQAATVVWVLGATAMMGYAAMSYIGVYRRVRTATKCESGVYACETVGSPFVFGLFRPRIYVPYHLEDTHMAAVMAHERAHIRRGDHLIKPLAFVLLAVYWFQPLLWVAYILLCRDIELACDEHVVKTLGEDARRAYSKALVTSTVGRRRLAACPLAFGEVAVKERVKNVMSYKKPTLWIVIGALIVSVAASVMLLTDSPAYQRQTHGSFEGAQLKFYRGDWDYDTLYLGKDADELSTSTTLGELGAFGFAVKEMDTESMTVTVNCNRDVWVNGECVRSFTVPCGEEVTVEVDETREVYKGAIRVELKPDSARDELDWSRLDEPKTVTFRRYVSGTTALYLYNGYFVLVEDDTGITTLEEPQGVYGKSTWPLSYDFYFPQAKRTEGRFEWTEDSLCLIADGELAYYEFDVNEDLAILKHRKGDMRLHKTSDAPVLKNGMTFTCEYAVEAEKNTDLRYPIVYTLSDGKGTARFTGKSELVGLEITSLGDGRVYVKREAPELDFFYEEIELIDLKKGESLGVRSRGASNHASMGYVGYVPAVTEANGKVYVCAQYHSWCGTGNPDPIWYELEGLSSLQNGTVNAVVDGDEIVISYQDDHGKKHVIAQTTTDGGTPMTRPFVTMTEFDADGNVLHGKREVYRGEDGVLTYNQIAAAYILVDGEYVDVLEYLKQDTLSLGELSKWFSNMDEEAILSLESQNGTTVWEFKDCDSYHTVQHAQYTVGWHEFVIGYPV